MDTDTIISIVSSVATVMAVIVALALGIIPNLIEKRKNRKLAEQRSYSLLKLLQKLVKDYKFYNPQKIIQDEKTQYQYDISNIQKMTINVNLYEETRYLNRLAEDLKFETKTIVLDTTDLLLKIASGYPYDSDTWDKLEKKIVSTLETLKKL